MFEELWSREYDEPAEIWDRRARLVSALKSVAHNERLLDVCAGFAYTEAVFVVIGATGRHLFVVGERADRSMWTWSAPYREVSQVAGLHATETSLGSSAIVVSGQRIRLTSPVARVRSFCRSVLALVERGLPDGEP